MLTKPSFVTAVLAALAAFTTQASGRVAEAIDKRQGDTHWVATWTSMPQLVEPNNMPPSQFVRLQSYQTEKCELKLF
jgi:hypothetical protein